MVQQMFEIQIKNTSGSGIGLHHEVDKLASPNSNICIGRKFGLCYERFLSLYIPIINGNF